MPIISIRTLDKNMAGLIFITLDDLFKIGSGVSPLELYIFLCLYKDKPFLEIFKCEEVIKLEERKREREIYIVFLICSCSFIRGGKEIMVSITNFYQLNPKSQFI